MERKAHRGIDTTGCQRIPPGYPANGLTPGAGWQSAFFIHNIGDEQRLGSFASPSQINAAVSDMLAWFFGTGEFTATGQSWSQSGHEQHQHSGEGQGSRSPG